MSCAGGKLAGMAPKPFSHFPIDTGLCYPAPAVVTEADAALLRSTTATRLKPGSPGTRRLLQRYGTDLLCVRYRVDHATGKRFTTVEQVVDERTGPAATPVWGRVTLHVRHRSSVPIF